MTAPMPMRAEGGRVILNNKLAHPVQYDRKAFTYHAYKHIIEAARLHGYQFLTMKEVMERSLPPRSIILQHNVPMAPNAAEEIARINREMGVIGIFTFDFQNPNIDLSNPQVVAQLRRIVEDYGQQVGIQHNPGDQIQGSIRRADFMNALPEIEAAVATKIDELENLIGKGAVQAIAYETTQIEHDLDQAARSEIIADLPAVCGLVYSNSRSLTQEGRTPIGTPNGVYYFADGDTQFTPIETLHRRHKCHLSLQLIPQWFTPKPMTPIEALRYHGVSEAECDATHAAMWATGRSLIGHAAAASGLNKMIEVTKTITVQPRPFCTSQDSHPVP